ncbi:MAG: hypothetical protein ACK5JD_01670 [Mangrovibacterium sp.]
MRKQDFGKAVELLKQLKDKADQAIEAIENKGEYWLISDLAIEDIEALTEQITAAISGNDFLQVNLNYDLVHEVVVPD